ncbi:MAG: glycosyltransferase [Verrucomicrobiota bacterium]|nr:glycosyltransferase [Verrucomicrobiota bacterium]
MSTLLVIPCFNESLRLPRFLPELCELLKASKAEAEIQLVDDGSTPEEKKALKDFARSLMPAYPFVREPILLDRNLGKGGAIRAGWDASNDFDFLAFVDADGAAPASETMRFLERLDALENKSSLLVAMREPDAGREIQRALSRKIVAKAFNTLLKIFYGIRIRDTQCGLKAVPAAFFSKLRNQLRQNGYGFDLELIANAKKEGLALEMMPIDWKEIPGSKTRIGPAIAFALQIVFRRI